MDHPPIGFALNRASKIVGRAFETALVDAGGSLPVWLVLLNLTRGEVATQRALADALGLREATLSHHLAAMEAGELITRRRDDGNRRVQVIELTAVGRAAFLRLRDAAVAFDERLRAGIADADVAVATKVLERLSANVAG